MTDQPPRRTGLRKVQVPGGEAGPPSRPLSSSISGTSSGAPQQAAPQPAAQRTLDPEQRARLEAEIVADASGALAASDALQRAADAVLARVGDDARAVYEATSQSARTTRDAAVEAADRAHVARAADLTARVIRAVDVLAPATAGAGWGGDWTTSGGEAGHLRIGTLPSGAAALAPFFETPGWFISGRRDRAAELVGGTVARAVSALPPRSVRLSVFDPRLRGALGSFGRLRSVDAVGFAAPTTTADRFRDALDAVLAAAAANAELLSSRGAPDMATLRRGSGVGVSTVVVVLDYPVGVDEQTQAVLERLAESGARLGVSLLVQDSGESPAKGVRPERLARLLTRVDESGDGWTASTLPDGLTAAHDGPVPPTVVETVVESIIQRASADTGPVFPLRELVEELGGGGWVESGAEELVAILGRADRAPVTLTLRSENPALPNVLVGGAVGQGKSNLLLDVIYSLAQRYSPSELEILLLDFKLGLEFRRFDADDSGRNWLPHARVLGLESDREFGLAVLDDVAAELTRRSDAFKAVRANSITSYRASTGAGLARILLVIDEFQVLFDGDDELTDAAVARLDQLAKQGRAFGIHLILSSQTASGISGLRTKGDGIFAQFPVRISMKNTVDESQAILSRQNTAAAELNYRGEFVINRNFGLDPANSNERAVAAYAEPEYVAELQAELWKRSPDGERPLVFLGRDYAIAPAVWPTPVAGGIDLVVGAPVAVNRELVAVRLTPDVDQSVALVGTGDAEAHAVLSSLVASALPQLRPGTRISLLDAESADAPAPWLSSLIARVEAAGVQVELVARDAIVDHLIEVVRPELDEAEAAPRLVVGVGLQRVPGIEDERPADRDAEFDFATVSGAEVLRRIGERGALRGHHLIGWWSTTRSLTDATRFGHEGVGTYIVLSTSLDDRRSFLGAGAQALEGSPRVTVVRRTEAETGQVVVPLDPAGLPGAAS